MTFISVPHTFHKAYRSVYKQAYEQALSILNELDPVDISYEYPETYDLSVLDILANLKKCHKSDDARELAIEVFTSWFSDKLKNKFEGIFTEAIGARLFKVKELMKR
jgi:hypothetical protein